MDVIIDRRTFLAATGACIAARAPAAGQAMIFRPEAFGAGVLEAITDPEVPNLPPHITFEEAKKFLSSMLEGDSAAPSMIRGAFKDAVESFLPHKE